MAPPALELDDIQSGVLRPRPTPFAATYIILRIDDRAAGRELMRRLSSVVASAAHPESPARDTWVSASLSFQGLKALGVPQASLETFSPQFQAGMAARAKTLGDVGDSSPEHWEKPLGSPDVHVVLTAISTDDAHLESALSRAQGALRDLPGVVAIWRQDCHVLPGEKEPFGFKDGISHPPIEGSGIPGTNPHEAALKPGEFVLGYPDEITDSPMIPQPDVLSRNGSYIVFRKLLSKRRSIPPISNSQHVRRPSRGTASGKDDGALAQRNAPSALSTERRSGDRSGSRTGQ